MSNDITPRVYVACLGCYNGGTLSGLWHDAIDVVDMEKAALTGCPRMDHEEYAIHDYEGFGKIRISEYENLDRVAELAAEISDNGPAFLAYVEHVGLEYADSFEDSYCGEYDSFRDFVESFHEDAGMLKDVPEWLEYHIDWESICREWEQSHTAVDAGNGGVYVFRD